MSDSKISSISATTNPPLVSETLSKALEERYFLVKQNKFWALIGGSIAFFVLVGFLSWKIAIATIESAGGEIALARIKADALAADGILKHMEDVSKKSDDNANVTVRLMDDRIARANKLSVLRQKVADDQDQIKQNEKPVMSELLRASQKVNAEKAQLDLNKTLTEIAELEKSG